MQGHHHWQCSDQGNLRWRDETTLICFRGRQCNLGTRIRLRGRCPSTERMKKGEEENIGKLAECVLLFKLLALLFLILKEGKRGG